MDGGCPTVTSLWLPDSSHTGLGVTQTLSSFPPQDLDTRCSLCLEGSSPSICHHSGLSPHVRSLTAPPLI